MNWTRQIVHVAARDVRRSRVGIAAYVLVVAATALASLTTDMPGLVLLVLLAGVLYTADLILADSPYRSDAFWASRPLYGTAVFAAKVVIVFGVVVGVAIAAHAASLVVAYGAVPPGLFQQLLSAALSAAVTMFGASVYAAVTPNLRTFFIVLLLAYALNSWILLRLFGPGYTGGTRAGIEAVWLLLLLAAVAWIYRTRNRTHGIVLAIGLALASFGIAAVQQSVAVPYERAETERGAVVRIVEVPTAAGVPNEFHIAVQLHNYNPSHLYTLTEPHARLHHADGRVERVVVPHTSVRLNDPAPVVDGTERIDPGARPLARAGEQSSQVRNTLIRLELSSEQEKSVRSGSAGIVLYGRLEITAPEVVTRLTLKAGQTVRADGLRMEIASVEVEDGRPRIRVRGFDFTTADARGVSVPADEEFVLVNRRRGQSSELSNVEGGSSLFGVLPSSYYANRFRRLLQLPGVPASPRLDPDWLRDAELVQLRWRSLGSYPISTGVAKADQITSR